MMKVPAFAGFGIATFALLCAPLASANEVPPEVAQALAEMRAVIDAQAAEIANLRAKVDALSSPATAANTAANTAAPRPTPAAAESAVPVLRAKPVSRSGLDLDFYGFVKLDAAYDSQRTVNGNLALYVLPESGNGDDDAFSLTARQTRLGATLSAQPIDGWKASGTAEIDFYGGGSENAANPRTRLAFAKVSSADWELLAGQDYDTWQVVLPNVVNFSAYGAQGALWSRRPQVRLTRHITMASGDKLSLAVGIARTLGASDIDGGGDGLDGGSDAPMPTFQWNALYTSKWQHGTAKFAFGGHYGFEEVEASATLRAEEFNTALAMLSFVIPVSQQWKLLGSIWSGENLGTWLGGIGQNLNLSRNTEIAATGGWIQAQFTPSKDLNLGVSIGLDDPDDGDLNPGMRSKNETLSLNLHWQWLPATTLAFEYQYLKTRYLGSTTASANRFQSAVIFKF